MLQIQPVLNLSSIETNFFYFWVDLADFFLLQYHGLQIDVSNSKKNEWLLNKIRLLKKRLYCECYWLPFTIRGKRFPSGPRLTIEEDRAVFSL